MSATLSTSESDRRGSVLYIGQDRNGRWLVQHNLGLLEGRFISRDAAWRFAREELHVFPGGRIVFTTQRMVPSFPLDPAPAATGAFERAA